MMCSCSPQLNSVLGQPCTKKASSVDCSGNDNSVSWIPAGSNGASASDVVESNLSCQNNVSNLSEDSLAQSSHCSQPELVKDGSFNSGTVPVFSPLMQTMKRADSLPSSLLRYVKLTCLVQNYICLQVSPSLFPVFIFGYFCLL